VDGLYLLGAGVMVYAVLVQITMLILQATAYSRHKHKSFLVLCLASISGVIYGGMAGLPYVVELAQDQLKTLMVISSIFAIISASLAVCGTALLFDSYRTLAGNGHKQAAQENKE